MDLESILSSIGDYGYIGLFFYLWLGIFIFPIPNEMVILTISVASSQGVWRPEYVFITVYAGMVASLTTAYILGRLVGGYLLPYLMKMRRFNRLITKANKLLNKYHAFSLSLSYFIPGIRFFLPFFYGVCKLSYRSFALYAYSGALLWLSIMFPLGYKFGERYGGILEYENSFLFAICALATIYVLFYWGNRKITRKRDKKKQQKVDLKKENS